MFKNTVHTILSVVLVLTVVAGCSSTAGSSFDTGQVTSQQSSSVVAPTSSDVRSQETSSYQKVVSSNDASSADISSANASSESTVSWVCPNPNAHYGTCINQASHNRLVTALNEAKNETSSVASSSTTSSQSQAEEFITKTVQYNNETVTITVLHGYDPLGNEVYVAGETNSWRGPNGEYMKIDRNTGEASIAMCNSCGKPYGNGHNGTCLHIFSKGHFNCDDPNQTCPFCGRHFGNGYNGTCYLTRAENDKIFCYHYDEGLRYYQGKNPEPI